MGGDVDRRAGMLTGENVDRVVEISSKLKLRGGGGQLFKAGLALTLGELKFNPAFQFRYFYTSIYFRTSKTKTIIDPDKLLEKFFQVYK